MSFTETKTQANHPPPGGLSTHEPENHPNQSSLSKELQVRKNNTEKGAPKKSIFRKMSALAKFRQTPLYRRLRKNYDKKEDGGDEVFTSLEERAEAAIQYIQEGGSVDNFFRFANGKSIVEEKEGDFSDVVIALLIDSGFDDHLVEVEAAGSNVTVYLDDRVGKRYKDVLSILGEVGIVQLDAKPQDNPKLGTFIYSVKKHNSSNPTDKLKAIAQKLPSDDSERKSESFTEDKTSKNYRLAKQPDTFTKKGKRILHDDTFTSEESVSKWDRQDRLRKVFRTMKRSKGKMHRSNPDRFKAAEKFSKAKKILTKKGYAEDFTPLEETNNPLGSNPAPRTGDIYIGPDRKPFRVTKLLGNKLIEVERNAFGGFGKPSKGTINVSAVENGLVSGSYKRISRNEAEEIESNDVFVESAEQLDKHYCPNCVIELSEQNNTFLCKKCEFVAEFANDLHK